MFETIGWPELLVIAIVFVVLFGGKKLPDLGKGIGDGIRNFKAGLRGAEEEAGKAADPQTAKPIEPAAQEPEKPVEKV